MVKRAAARALGAPTEATRKGSRTYDATLLAALAPDRHPPMACTCSPDVAFQDLTPAFDLGIAGLGGVPLGGRV